MNLDSRIERLAWVLVVYAVITFAASLAFVGMADLTSGTTAWISSLMVLIFAGCAAVNARLLRRETLEEQEFEAFRREHGSSELFEDEDERLRLTRRTRRQFLKFVVPAIAAVSGALLIFVSMSLLRRWQVTAFTAEAEDPLLVAACCALLCIVGLVLGSFVNGASRETGGRWLRPAAQWVFLNALFFLACTAVLVVENFGAAADVADPWVARVGVVVLGVLGVELVLGVIFDFYRPRTSRGETVPLIESRLLSLFTEPGGIAKNFALALDYQFGFQVSNVWFYRFLERTLLPFAGVMAISFWALTCVTVVESEENGIRQRFGKVVKKTPLDPGIYAKLPWPLATIHTFPVDRVQELPIGYQRGTGDEEDFDVPPEMVGDASGRVIVWSKAHNREETKFVTPTEMIEDLEDLAPAAPGHEKPVPVYFISASVPLYYKVSNLYEYRFGHSDARKVLLEVATEEVVRYMSQHNFFSIMRNLGPGGHRLGSAIQERANELKLGVDVVFVGLQGIHPPVEVGEKFDDVVAAMEDKHRLILEGDRDAIVRRPTAEAEAIRTVAEAEIDKQRRLLLARAEVERFFARLSAYEQSPRIFMLRTYLELLENAAPQLRKYVVAPFNAHEVYSFDFEEKIRPDLLDVQLD
ncbi:MAG: hypothetical protein ACOCWJ_03260 [Verrucomicrobiota bacterium]